MKTILIFGENEYLSTWNCFYTAVRICLYILRSRISKYVQFRWGLKVAALGTTKSYLTSFYDNIERLTQQCLQNLVSKVFFFEKSKEDFIFVGNEKREFCYWTPVKYLKNYISYHLKISVAGQIWFQHCIKSVKYKRLIRIIYLSHSF